MKKNLIVGLGNIGEKYTNTRHNIGFKIVDAFVKEHQGSFETEKLGDLAKLKIKGLDRTTYFRSIKNRAFYKRKNDTSFSRRRYGRSYLLYTVYRKHKRRFR